VCPGPDRFPFETGVETLDWRTNLCDMSTGTEEIIRLCEALPADKRAAVADFARFLLTRTDHPDDVAWEQMLNDPRPLPKLEAFLKESATEGRDEPLDLKRL
jgi:hypothetical protein